MSTFQILQPPGWARPKGFSNGIACEGRLVFIAGQFRQALANILEVLKEANGGPEHIVRLTWYVLDKQEYLNSLAEVGKAYRELMGRNYPTMAVLQVGGLIEDAARLEIEATAVVPHASPRGGAA
jgi:enamine deaminase RidA (YjgF/YER057c/UK114 family)